MKLKSFKLVLLTAILCFSCGTKSTKQVISFVERKTEKSVDVMIDGKLFTSYCWFDNVMKPILFPILTSAGTIITRGYPLKPRPFETTDHPHHVGCWLNYGDVNGIDFWSNLGIDISNQDTSKSNLSPGSIKHLLFESLTGGNGEGVMVCKESWIIDSSGKELLAERTEYHFIAKGSTRIIDRNTTLTATGEPVTFNDTKEGMFGIRVARELELPSKDQRTMTDAHGNPSSHNVVSTENVTGNYISSEGVKGDSVWGKRARWMNLNGNISNEKISVVICDHPENVSYPTFWHARGYGLFCANPFGANVFTDGKQKLYYTIPAGKSITLRYRIIVNSGSHLTNSEINAYADDFARKYL
jgi:hypothetical protein